MLIIKQLQKFPLIINTINLETQLGNLIINY